MKSKTYPPSLFSSQEKLSNKAFSSLETLLKQSQKVFVLSLKMLKSNFLTIIFKMDSKLENLS